MPNYAEIMKGDLIEQFRGKPHIEALAEVIGTELQEVYDFFEQLRDQRELNTAIGKQLDGVGGIAVLSRSEAGQLAGLTNPGEVVTDDNYRKYLIYKVLKNTCNCTYPDIIKAFRMFWNKPLYYSEDPEHPATMIMTTDTLKPGDEPEKLLSAPIIKAAGIGVKVVAITETDEMDTEVVLTAVLGRGYTVTKLPEIEPEIDFSHTEHFSTVAHNVTKTILPELKEETA